MRQFQYYYVPKEVTGLVDTAGAFSAVKSTIYFGHRMQDLLLTDSSFQRALGYETRDNIQKKLQPSDPQITFMIIYTGSDISRMGLMGFLNFNLIPVNPGKTVAPFGDKYPSSLGYSRNIAPPQVYTAIYNQVWTFISGNSKQDYRVEPGSIKEKRSKSNTPTYF